MFHSQVCDAVDCVVIQGHHMSTGPLTLNYYSVTNKTRHHLSYNNALCYEVTISPGLQTNTKTSTDLNLACARHSDSRVREQQILRKEKKQEKTREKAPCIYYSLAIAILSSLRPTV